MICDGEVRYYEYPIQTQERALGTFSIIHYKNGESVISYRGVHPAYPQEKHIGVSCINDGPILNRDDSRSAILFLHVLTKNDHSVTRNNSSDVEDPHKPRPLDRRNLEHPKHERSLLDIYKKMFRV